MATCRYLFRFDDICPTMNWTVWDAIEAQLIRFNVQPILAVVPDNRDPELMVDPPRADFWERVRGWQAMGWTIALHGYQHQYVNQDPGILRLTRQSEFASLSRREQEAKLRKGLAIFAANGVRAEAWVAPSHSFDRNTVEVLAELGVKVISDGLWTWPFTEAGGTTWIPQQLWKFQPQSSGVWTICNHHNGWTGPRLAAFLATIARYSANITGVAAILQDYSGRRQPRRDRWIGFCRLRLHRLRAFFYHHIRRKR